MRRLTVALTAVAFVLALGVPALADSYHQVYQAQFDGVGNFLGWALTEDAEMFSEDSASGQYRWESAEGVGPCDPDYVEPTREPPVQFDILNHVHLFPWIECHITETHLTWDIFKPGNYMAKAFIIQLKANCPVQVHLGGGEWYIPDVFVDGKLNGHIEPGLFAKPGFENEAGNTAMLEDKRRLRGLLTDLDGAYKNPGTDPDVIESRWWWYVATGGKPPEHSITAAEFALMPPKPEWRLGTDLNCEPITFPDTEDLHILNNTHIVFFEDLYVEQCDSEGKYIDEFAVTITADP